MKEYSKFVKYIQELQKLIRRNFGKVEQYTLYDGMIIINNVVVGSILGNADYITTKFDTYFSDTKNKYQKISNNIELSKMVCELRTEIRYDKFDKLAVSKLKDVILFNHGFALKYTSDEMEPFPQIENVKKYNTPDTRSELSIVIDQKKIDDFTNSGVVIIPVKDKSIAYPGKYINIKHLEPHDSVVLYISRTLNAIDLVSTLLVTETIKDLFVVRLYGKMVACLF